MVVIDLNRCIAILIIFIFISVATRWPLLRPCRVGLSHDDRRRLRQRQQHVLKEAALLQQSVGKGAAHSVRRRRDGRRRR